MREKAERKIQELFIHLLPAFRSIFNPVTPALPLCSLLLLFARKRIVVFSFPLRGIHRPVSHRKQSLIISSILTVYCHADAECHLNDGIIADQLFSGFPAQRRGARFCLLWSHIPHQRQKFISSDSCGDICLLKLALQHAGNISNYRISDGMPECIVDPLKIINIDQEQHMLFFRLTF